MATSTYLQNSHTGTGSSTGEKATMSLWVKRTDPSGDTRSTIIGARTDDNNYFKIRFADNDRLMVYGAKAGSTNVDIQTNAEFRDVSGWYHIVLQIDTTHATDTERVKWYVNGELQTIYSTGKVYPSQNDVNHLTSASDINIGCNAVGSPNEHFDGTMSHFHMIDGTIYPPTAFGSTDSTTGEWKITTAPSVTYGAKGYFILKDGNSVTDQSGNSNNFTVGAGTLTKTEDNPSNVFATFNPLGRNRDVTFSNGNCTATYGTSGTRDIVIGTLGANSGKYYWEIEMQGSNADNGVLGVSMSDWETGYAVAGETNQSWGFKGYDGAVQNNNSSVGGTWATFTAGDKIGVAINLDNEQGGLNKLYFSKNGTWLNGSDPSNFTSVVGVVGITKPENGNTGFYFPVVSDAGSNATPQFKANFGNGYFGTTAVSSAGTNASGIGIFEYDVPTGFTALSTKGLNL